MKHRSLEWFKYRAKENYNTFRGYLTSKQLINEMRQSDAHIILEKQEFNELKKYIENLF